MISLVIWRNILLICFIAPSFTWGICKREKIIVTAIFWFVSISKSSKFFNVSVSYYSILSSIFFNGLIGCIHSRLFFLTLCVGICEEFWIWSFNQWMMASWCTWIILKLNSVSSAILAQRICSSVCWYSAICFCSTFLVVSHPLINKRSFFFRLGICLRLLVYFVLGIRFRG